MVVEVVVVVVVGYLVILLDLLNAELSPDRY